MNANPLVMAALGGLPIPVCWLEYKGKAEEYITFNDALNAPSLYADDLDELDTVILQIHHYTKGDPQKRLKEIRNALRKAGFTILETLTSKESIASGGVNLKNDTTTGFIHSIIKVQIEGRSDDFEEEE